MKHLIYSFLVTLPIFLSSNVQAQVPEHAVVFKEDFCVVYVVVSEEEQGFVIGNKLHANIRPNGSGKFTCQGPHDLELDRAFTVPVVCFVPQPDGPVLITEQGRLVLSAGREGGQLGVQCHFREEGL